MSIATFLNNSKKKRDLTDNSKSDGAEDPKKIERRKCEKL